MVLALGTASLTLVTLLSVLARPHLQRSLEITRQRSFAWLGHEQQVPVEEYDPGRELRAEQRARSLLRSCVNEEDWAMYSELGFLRVWGTLETQPYAYLIYPHKPILAYIPSTSHMLGEYCIEFPDRTRPFGSTRLPDSDDVLAKWMALTADERALIEQANMHLAGRQIRVAKARRDLVRLACWERERTESRRRAPRRAGSVPAL
jgi:hypothetical protein